MGQVCVAMTIHCDNQYDTFLCADYFLQNTMSIPVQSLKTVGMESNSTLRIGYQKRNKQRELVIRFITETSLKTWIALLESSIGGGFAAKESNLALLRLQRGLSGHIGRIYLSFLLRLRAPIVSPSQIGPKRPQMGDHQSVKVFAMWVFSKIHILYKDRMLQAFRCLETHYRFSVQSAALEAGESLAALNEAIMNSVDLQIGLSKVAKLLAVRGVLDTSAAFSKLRSN